MTAKSRNDRSDIPVNLTVDDETLAQLQTLAGQRVVRATVWDDSITEALAAGDLAEPAADVDVYLSDGVFFELFGVLCYPDLDSDPLADQPAIQRRIAALTAGGARIEEIAVDTEDDLVLVLADREGSVLYLNAGAWALGDWEELPKQP